MNRILFTNVNGSGDNVLVFTHLTAEVMRAAYEKAPRKITFDDCTPIREDEVQFYLFEPCWLDPRQEQHAIQLAAA